MVFNAYDVQVCLWKMLKFSSKTCVTVSINHPYVSSALLCMFLLYICFPLVFWILVYSLPLVVCTCVIISIFSDIRNGRKYKDGEGENGGNYSKKTKFAADEGDDKSKKPYGRVHSVRRRRAKEIEIMREDDAQHNVEEKNEVSSININCDMVDKKALVEESPKEIREVEVDFSLANSAKDTSSAAAESLKHENEEGSNQIRRLELFKDEEEANKADQVRRLELFKDEEEANKGVQGNEEDQKSVMDVGISDSERNKRLESLIARRRSRKLLSLQVRRSLMNMDRNDHSGGQIPSLTIPKINTYSPSKMADLFSPGPGSAPSILIPMRNPFDLPYDPQEEKPVLTGDSFHQEFTSVNNRDMMFCRHESFSLGPSLPEELFQSREETSSGHDFGFRQRGFSTGYRFSKLGNESDKEFAPIMEQESYDVSESKLNTDSTDDDQIKEVIQVYENDTENPSEEGENEVETRQVSQEEFSSSSSTKSSSEEDQPMFKIDREAILKSLSSMRRNVILEIENNEKISDNLSYANSALENASRLKQQYYADKPLRRHATSYSIASDMQVEVSEVSSPPLTIDENMYYQNEDVSSYDGEMERNISSDGEDMWAGSSRMSEVDDNESRSTLVNEVNEQDIVKGEAKKREDTALSNTMEEPLNEKHCIHSCSSTAEFSNNGDKILEDENEHQRREYATVESNTGIEQSAAESTKSSEEIVEVSTIAENHVNIEPNQQIEDEQSSGRASISQVVMDSDDHQEQSLMLNEDIEPIQQTEDEGSSSEASVSKAGMDSNDHQEQSLMPNVDIEPLQQIQDEQRSRETSTSQAAMDSNDHEEQSLMPNVDIEPLQQIEDEKSYGEASISQATMDSNDHQEQSLMPSVDIEPIQQIEDEQSSAEASISQAALDSNEHEEQSLMPDVDIKPIQQIEDGQISGEASVSQAAMDSNDHQQQSLMPNVDIKPIQQIEDEQSSSEAGVSQVAMDSNDHREQSLMPNVALAFVQTNIISPKSVLLPSFSQSNFEPDIDEEVQHSGAHAAEALSPVPLQNSTALMEESRDLPFSHGDAEVSQESSEPTVAFTIEAEDFESVNEKMKIQENDEQPKEVGGSSSSQILETHEAPAQTREETSSTSLINTDEVSSKDFEGANATASIKNIENADNSIPSLSTEEELPKHQEIVTGEATHNDSTKTSSYEDQTDNSDLHEETGNERRTHSTSDNVDGTKDEVRHFDAGKTPVALSELVEDNDKSESSGKNEADRKDEQANSHEAVPETNGTLDNETTQE